MALEALYGRVRRATRRKKTGQQVGAPFLPRSLLGRLPGRICVCDQCCAGFVCFEANRGPCQSHLAHFPFLSEDGLGLAIFCSPTPDASVDGSSLFCVLWPWIWECSLLFLPKVLSPLEVLFLRAPRLVTQVPPSRALKKHIGSSGVFAETAQPGFLP